MPKVIPEYKEQARKRILATAADVFAQRGYHEATMDEVANAIGVSKGAVYQYFKSKEELFQELCLINASELEEALRSGFVGGDFRKVAEGHMDAELERHSLGRALLMFESLAEAPRNLVLQKMVGEVDETYVEIISNFIDRLKDEGKITREADSTSVARVVVALRHGVIVSVMCGLGTAEAKKVWMAGIDALIQDQPHPLRRRQSDDKARG